MDAQHPSTSPRDRLPLVVTPAQVIALGLVAVSIGWAVWLLRDRPTSEEVELLAGMTLPSSEMAIMEAAFDYLDAPVASVTGKDVPMPYAANLEKLALPNVGEVVQAAKAVCYR